MKSKFERYLSEKTFELDEDVDYIYTKSKMDKFITAIKDQDTDYIMETLKNTRKGDEYIFAVIDSSELTNESSVQASKIKPVKITVGILERGSFYQPKKDAIQISLNYGAFNLMKGYGFDKNTAERNLHKQTQRFMNEFSSHSFKGSTYHELTHWIDDVLHGSFLSKKIDKASEHNNVTILQGKLSSVNHTNFEVNSQVHAVKQIKRELSEEEFDDLTWENLFRKKASIMSNFSKFKSESEYTDFIHRFVSRLHRENILPKAMRKIPSWKDMNKILASV